MSRSPYERILERLFALRRFGVRPGLGAIEAALERLGHPERAFPAVHVAGTNGKGSTAAICEAILRADGRRVGLYTSPHLSRFTERVRIDGAEISRAEITGFVDEAFAAGPELTFFEVVTAAAFLALARAKVEIAVVEVGLGGRLDATNALARPLVSIITNVALDHTEILGETTAAIAAEKAGILRVGVPGVIGLVDPDAAAVIAARGAKVDTPLSWLGRDFALGAAPTLLGAHQARNAAIAEAALLRLPEALRPSGSAIARGLAEARWPGRLERLTDDLIVDGAHNPDGAAALAAALPVLAAGRPIHLVLGTVEEKDAADQR
jgi:dihydrofolate synthase/folylpolyglutamate synthase